MGRETGGGEAACDGASKDAVVGVGASAGVRRRLGTDDRPGVCLDATGGAIIFAGTFGGDGDRKIGLSVSL
jgi:hypothetical protein